MNLKQKRIAVLVFIIIALALGSFSVFNLVKGRLNNVEPPIEDPSIVEPPVVEPPVVEPPETEDPDLPSQEEPDEDPPIEIDECFLLGFWPLILVNQDNPLPLSYEPIAMSSVDGYYELDAEIVPITQEMIAEAYGQGIHLRLVSAFRDSGLQSYLYNAEVEYFIGQGYDQEEAEVEAAKWVALPGQSEHQTGLAADIVSYDWLAAGKGLTVDFAEDPAAIWLKTNAHNFGFILRYPEDKTDITGISFEPWHYRYVGKEAAKIIYEYDWCLEEFFEHCK